MDLYVKNIIRDVPKVRGKHFKVLKWQFFTLLSFGMINIAITISDNYVENGFLANFKNYVFPITIPSIIITSIFIIKKLIYLDKRTNILVSYVDQIMNDE